MENYADNEPSFFKVKNGEIDEDVYVEHDDDDSLTLSFDDEFVFMDIKSYEIDEDNLELKYHCVDDDLEIVVQCENIMRDDNPRILNAATEAFQAFVAPELADYEDDDEDEDEYDDDDEDDDWDDNDEDDEDDYEEDEEYDDDDENNGLFSSAVEGFAEGFAEGLLDDDDDDGLISDLIDVFL
jgi:hypothetical protein